MKLYDVYKIIQKKELDYFYENLDKKNKIKIILGGLFNFALCFLLVAQLDLLFSGFLSWLVFLVTGALFLFIFYKFSKFIKRLSVPAMQRLCYDLQKELNIVIFENDNKVVRHNED